MSEGEQDAEFKSSDACAEAEDVPGTYSHTLGPPHQIGGAGGVEDFSNSINRDDAPFLHESHMRFPTPLFVPARPERIDAIDLFCHRGAAAKPLPAYARVSEHAVIVSLKGSVAGDGGKQPQRRGVTYLETVQALPHILCDADLYQTSVAADEIDVRRLFN